MIPNHFTADAARGAEPMPAAHPQRVPGCADPSDESMARINRLVATIKAERESASAPPRIAEAGERGQLVALLRRFLAARERERLAWEERLRGLEAALAEAKAAGGATQERAAADHRRALADLELLHEHQRSIWALERRRLEVTVAALERTLRARATRRRARLAFAASLLVVAGLGFGIAGDNDPARMAGKWLERFDAARQLPLAELLRQDLPATSAARSAR